MPTWCRRARLGGDELAFFTSDHNTSTIIDDIRTSLNQPIDIDGVVLDISVSIGLAFSRDGGDAPIVLERAGSAMYRAKRDPALPYAVHPPRGVEP